MASTIKKAPLCKRSFVEALGTFIFVFLGAGSAIAASYAGLGGSALLAVAFANGIGLALAISFTMNISGGHINPAVTIAAFINKLISTKDAIIYIIAQIIGATLAGILLVAIFPALLGVMVHYGAPTLGSGVSVVTGITLEAIMTLFLVLMVFGTIVDQRAPKMAGFGVGLIVVIDVLVGGAFTGAAMNPARAIGPMIASGFFANWYVYWIGPIIGAVIAALIYKYIIK
jgi:MIP family channel proteins